jgi:tRNA dimethylallyltransferase
MDIPNDQANKTELARTCIAIVGPTASGKTGFAVELAQKINGQVICMDSATVYRGFDIGTSKPSAADRQKVTHHLVDILDPNEPFSAYHFVQYADEIIDKVHAEGRVPIIVGGTYFYLRALQHGMYPTPVIPAEVIENLEKEFFEDETLNTARMHEELKKKDPKSAEVIHPNDRYRLLRALAILRTTDEKPSELKPQVRSETQRKRIWMKYALLLSRHTLNQNILRRAERMLHDGLVEETKRLMERFPQARPLQSIGYAESCLFLNKKLTEKQLRNEIIEKTRQLAKRQTTWLRSDPEIRYVDFRDLSRVELEVGNLTFALGAE